MKENSKKRDELTRAKELKLLTEVLDCENRFIQFEEKRNFFFLITFNKVDIFINK